MKKRTKIIIGLLVVCAAALVGAGCSASSNPYGGFNKNGYEISVFYDSNGGYFSTSTNSNLVDTLPKSAFKDGKAKLLAPGDERRGPSFGGSAEALNRSIVSRSGYFLAGWYQTRELRTDGDGNPLDDYGEPCSVSGNPQGYIYNGKWDFDTAYLEIDTSKTYDANKPVMTLYAGWIPYFSFSFQAKEDGATEWSQYGSYSFDYTTQEHTITIPEWNEASGAVTYGNFTQLSGKTFEGVYSDGALTSEITEKTVIHDGSINLDRGIALNPVKKLYTTWKDGIWFKIKTVKQLSDNARLDGCYEILADTFDFSEIQWPFTGKTFAGKILSENGATFKNITAGQYSTNDLLEGGLFKSITETAEIKNITFDNVTYNFNAGSRLQGGAFGLFAGNISPSAKFENVTVNGKINVGSVYENYSAGDDERSFISGYNLGLLCGNATETISGMSYNITCESVADTRAVVAEGGVVRISVVTPAQDDTQ